MKIVLILHVLVWALVLFTCVLVFFIPMDVIRAVSIAYKGTDPDFILGVIEELKK